MAVDIGTENRDEAALRLAHDAHQRLALEMAGGGRSEARGYVAMRRGRGAGSIAMAGWDGTIHLGPETLEQVRGLFRAGPPVRRDRDRLRALADGLHACLHEHAHVIVPEGRSWAENAVAYRQWPVSALEEGVTEAWTQDRLPQFLRHHDALAPGLGGVRVETGSYSGFVPAVRQLAWHLGDRLGLGPDEVIAALNRRGAAAKLPMLAYLGLRAGDAWERMPAGQRQRCLSTVTGIVHHALEQNRRWAAIDPAGQVRSPDPAGHSAIMGLQLVSAIDRAVLELRHRHMAEDRDWHRTAVEREIGLARHARALARGRHRDTTVAAEEWYAEAKAALRRTRARAIESMGVSHE
jgi:hypothetical protein